MKVCFVILLCCITLVTMIAYAQTPDGDYQMARVVSFERMPADSQHMENADHYKIAMRMGNIVYVCHGSGSASTFIDWSEGKEFPAKLNGKTLLVKSPNGEVVELTITGKKTPK